MPFWRDKLIEMAYNPLTRVDVRRMHKLGILNRDQVYKAYLDIGYSPEKAEWLTQFTEAINKEEAKQEKLPNRDLTRGQIEKAYKERMIEADAALAMLKSIGYDEAESEFLIAMIDWQLAVDERDRQIDIVAKKYKAGIIDINEVWSELSQLNLTAREMQKVRDELELLTIREPKLPTIDQLNEFIKTGVIGIEEYIDSVNRLGYTKKDSLRFLGVLLRTKKLAMPKPGESGYELALKAIQGE